MTDREIVTLREHFESRLAYEVKLFDQRFEAMEAWLHLKFAELSQALKLQAVETERRLVHLNNSQDLAIKEQMRTLPRTDFEAWLKEHDKWREDVQRSMSAVLNVERSTIDLRVRQDALKSEYDIFKLEVAKSISAAAAEASTRTAFIAAGFAILTLVMGLVAIFWRPG